MTNQVRMLACAHHGKGAVVVLTGIPAALRVVCYHTRPVRGRAGQLRAHLIAELVEAPTRSAGL
ncbi:MAG TPA: hypothetical protein VIL18_14175 [Longimicrobiales bacterium]